MNFPSYRLRVLASRLALCLSITAFGLAALAQNTQQKLEMDWNKIRTISKSTPTLQVVTNPMLNPGSPIHDQSFAALKALGAFHGFPIRR